MKITFLLPHLKPAGGVYAPIVFAHELSTRGHSVTIAVESKVWTRYVRNLFNRHPLLPKGSSVRIIRVKNFSELPDADIFMSVSWWCAKKMHALTHITARKFDYIQHDERMYHGEARTVEATFRYPFTRIANATWLKRMFKEEFHEEVPLLINAVDCVQFNPGKRTRSEDGLIKVLVLHHDYEWKGTKEGVAIVSALKKKYPNVRLVLFGTRKKDVEYVCDEYYYKLYGDDLARMFANCDIFLGPSWDEGLNFPPRWAMASGCAVVTYDNGSSEEYAFDGETALVARRKDQRDLSAKLESLIANPDLRRELAGRGMEYVRNMPTWKDLTDILEGLFSSAITAK